MSYIHSIWGHFIFTYNMDSRMAVTYRDKKNVQVYTAKLSKLVMLYFKSLYVKYYHDFSTPTLIPEG